MTIFQLLLRKFATQTWFSKCQQYLAYFTLSSHLGSDRQLPRDVPTLNMELRSPTSKFNVRCSNIELRSRSWDFNDRFSGSNMEFRSPTLFDVPPSPAPLSCLNLFFSFFFFFFFSTPNFKARLQSFNFELRTSILEF